MHCCCVIVEISPAQQKLNGSRGSKVGGHSGNGTASKGPNRKPVCICNAQYRWQQELLLKKAVAQEQQQTDPEATAEKKKQAKKEESGGYHQDGNRTVGTHLAFINRNDDQSPLLLSKKHGSLDRLLQLSHQHQEQHPCVSSVAAPETVKIRTRHEKLTRKVKSTESALPSALAGSNKIEKLSSPIDTSQNMDLSQLQHLQYLQRAPYPTPLQQQQQQQVVLQAVAANQSMPNVNEEYNRKLFQHQQQQQQHQQKLLENVQTCQQTAANSIPTSDRRHHHHPHYFSQVPANTSLNIKAAGGTVHQSTPSSATDAKEVLIKAGGLGAIGPEGVGEGERREKKIVWSNHVHHKSSANGPVSKTMAQNFQLQKNPTFPSVPQYHHHQKLTSEVCSRNYQQQATPPSGAVIIEGNGRPEFFDRSQRLRQSSRSVGDAENIIYQTLGAPTNSNLISASKGSTSGGHHRHSSGPSEMSLLKEDIAKLLSQLSITPSSAEDVKKKATARSGINNASTAGSGRSVEFMVKDDSCLGQVVKRSVQRQSSGPGDVTALRNDLIEWLTRQQATISLGGGGGTAGGVSGKQIVNKEDLYAKVVKPSQQNPGISHHPVGAAATAVGQVAPPVPKPRKRHSVGHEGESHASERSRKHSPQSYTPNVIQKFEIPKEMLAQLELNSSYVDLQLRRPSKSSTSQHHVDSGKTLRHSASEVVTTTTSSAINGKQSQSQQQHSSRSSSKSKRHHTQRSATVSEMVLPSSSSAGRQSSSGEQRVRHTSRKQSAQRRSSSSISSLPKCTDPTCPFLPICTDPDCCYLANCYDRIRYTQHIPRCRCKRCTPKCADVRCNSLPRCMDSKCPVLGGSSGGAGSGGASLTKCNSLPRCAESSTSSFIHNNYLQDNCAEFPLVPQNNSQRRYNGSRSSLPPPPQEQCRARASSSSGGRHHTASSNKTENGTHGSKYNNNNTNHHQHHNGKLVKSVSAASLNSRRRRHKTVHFGDNLLREVCQNRKFMKSEYVNVPATSSTTTVALQEFPGQIKGTGTSLQPNIEMLYNFIEGVLSSWVDDDYDDMDAMGGSSSLSRWTGAESDPERGSVKPLYRCNRARIQTIRRVVSEAAQLKGSAKLGNQRYRHRHWRGTAKDCNERFLRKVI